MTPEQANAFNQGAGSGAFTAGALFEAIQVITGAVLFLYIVWICARAYNDFGDEEVSAKDMLITWAKAIFLLLLVLYLLRS